MLRDELSSIIARPPSPPAVELRDRPLLLYGAGNLGRSALAKLRQQGIEPFAFVDETPGKEGTSIDGLQVLTPARASGLAPDGSVFAVTILNNAYSFLKAKARLSEHGCGPVISFFELALACPGFLPHYLYDRPANVLRDDEDIMRAFDLWEDEESRSQYVAHIKFRLTADYANLPPASDAAYFPSDVPLPDLRDKITFVDCGAYDGDTIAGFLERSGGCFSEIYAFEPDPANARRLRQSVDALDRSMADRIHLFEAAVGSERGRLAFDASGGMASSLGDGGQIEVDVLAIQDVLPHRQYPNLYIKYDVEGGEMAALKGTERLIARCRPSLAVSLYHRPADLWRLPNYIRGLDPAYRLYLRTEGTDGMDAICYAVS